MIYLQAVLEFLTKYDLYFLPILFGMVFLFGMANWSVNVYAKQNAKFERCRRKIISNPQQTAKYIQNLPSEYRRQYRAYVSSGASRPSLVFEFVKCKNKLLFWRTFIAVATIVSAYIVAFAFDLSHRDYVIYQVAFWLAFAIVLVINGAVYRSDERKARKIFAKLVAELNKHVEVKPQQQDNVTADAIKQLSKCNVTDEVLTRASEILRDKGLSGERTVEEQRKINCALNGLLQSYARNQQ